VAEDKERISNQLRFIQIDLELALKELERKNYGEVRRMIDLALFDLEDLIECLKKEGVC